MVRLALAIASVVVMPAAVAGLQAWPAPLSIDDAVTLALRDNATLLAKQHEYRAVQAGEITAGLRPNPVTSYVAEQLGNRNIDPQHTVTLGQPIELGGKRQRRLDSARASSRVTDVYLPKAQRARDTVEFAYRRGGASLLDFLDAQRTYRETTLDHLRTLGNYAGAIYQREAAVGGLLEP